MARASTSVRRGPRDVFSAGVVVFGPDRTVLLVHRPKYDDWSFPKGKLDPGERAEAAAVREVEEETGLRVRLGPPLGSQRYPIRDGMKTVLYWTGRPVDETDVSTYEPNAEIDGVRWVAVDKARSMLTYPHDVETLDEALPLRKRTRTLVVLRHAIARSKKSWHKDDRLRPLLASGHRQSERLVPVLAAYGVSRLVTSSSTRCTQTLQPYADLIGRKLEMDAVFSQEDATQRAARREVAASPSSSRRHPRTPAASCCAPTGRCSRGSSTPSGSRTRASRRARCSSSTCATAGRRDGAPPGRLKPVGSAVTCGTRERGHAA